MKLQSTPIVGGAKDLRFTDLRSWRPRELSDAPYMGDGRIGRAVTGRTPFGCSTSPRSRGDTGARRAAVSRSGAPPGQDRLSLRHAPACLGERSASTGRWQTWARALASPLIRGCRCWCSGCALSSGETATAGWLRGICGEGSARGGTRRSSTRLADSSATAPQTLTSTVVGAKSKAHCGPGCRS